MIQIQLSTERVYCELTLYSSGRSLVVGPLGCGKSEVIRALKQLQDYTSGKVSSVDFKFVTIRTAGTIYNAIQTDGKVVEEFFDSEFAYSLEDVHNFILGFMFVGIDLHRKIVKRYILNGADEAFDYAKRLVNCYKEATTLLLIDDYDVLYDERICTRLLGLLKDIPSVLFCQRPDLLDTTLFALDNIHIGTNDREIVPISKTTEKDLKDKPLNLQKMYRGNIFN